MYNEQPEQYYIKYIRNHFKKLKNSPAGFNVCESYDYIKSNLDFITLDCCRRGKPDIFANYAIFHKNNSWEVSVSSLYTDIKADIKELSIIKVQWMLPQKLLARESFKFDSALDLINFIDAVPVEEIISNLTAITFIQKDDNTIEPNPTDMAKMLQFRNELQLRAAMSSL
jgi:hypothetical protein